MQQKKKNRINQYEDTLLSQIKSQKRNHGFLFDFNVNLFYYILKEYESNLGNQNKSKEFNFVITVVGGNIVQFYIRTNPKEEI